MPGWRISGNRSKLVDASRFHRDSFGSAETLTNKSIKMNYSVYILYSATFDRYYIGQTNNLDNRIKRHNNGYVRSTKPYRPWKIAFRTNTKDRKSAVRLENQIKSYKLRVKIQEFIYSDQNIVKK